MSDWFFNRGGRKRLVDWLDLDSRLDSGLFTLYEEFKRRWNTASATFARFRLTGFRRVLNEIASEMATMGLGGAAVMLILAQPAFEAVQDENWLSDGYISVTFLDRYGNEIGKRGINRSDAVPLEEIPDVMIKALLSTEDRRFFEHWGVDVFGTLRALAENLRANEVVQGGSSITQQLAKNLFLTSERSLERKIKEAFLALWLETHLTKREILKLYFDRAYMGGGAFGFEAAAQFYFGKSIRDVTLAEAALLAGLPKAPTKYAPHINLAAARARADEVLTNMVQAGFMTEGQVHGARLNPAQPIQTGLASSPDWFLDWAYEEAKRILEGQQDQVFIARTTVDLDMQRTADQTIASTIAENGRAKRVKQGALVSMETDGAVRALVGGVDYGDSQFNRASQGRRQAGSTFKPYVYLTALENGWTPTKTMRDTSPFCKPNHYVTNFSGGASGRSMQLIEALSRSTNTIAVRLSHEVGIKKVAEVAKRLGLSKVDTSCTMALGTTDLTLLEHTGAYAVFANGGKAVRPYAITDIQNSRGEVVYSRDKQEPAPRQAFDPKVIAQLNSMLRRVVEAGTARRAELDFTNVAGKTGTTSSFKDAWFMGFSGKYVTGIWFGNDESTPMNNVTGGQLVAPAWKTFMTAVHTNIADIAPIPGIPVHPVQQAEMDRVAALRTEQPVDETGPGTLPERTLTVLKDLADALRKAAGRPASTGDATDPGNLPKQGNLEHVPTKWALTGRTHVLQATNLERRSHSIRSHSALGLGPASAIEGARVATNAVTP
ncbi:MAG: PBP1A family penicillin-binding protein [Hyphomicrobiaceae bacterium]